MIKCYLFIIGGAVNEYNRVQIPRDVNALINIHHFFNTHGFCCDIVFIDPLHPTNNDKKIMSDEYLQYVSVIKGTDIEHLECNYYDKTLPIIVIDFAGRYNFAMINDIYGQYFFYTTYILMGCMATDIEYPDILLPYVQNGKIINTIIIDLYQILSIGTERRIVDELNEYYEYLILTNRKEFKTYHSEYCCDVIDQLKAEIQTLISLIKYVYLCEVSHHISKDDLSTYGIYTMHIDKVKKYLNDKESIIQICERLAYLIRFDLDYTLSETVPLLLSDKLTNDKEAREFIECEFKEMINHTGIVFRSITRKIK